MNSATFPETCFSGQQPHSELCPLCLNTSISCFFLKPSTSAFPQLSFSLISTILRGVWKELEVLPSARKRHTQVCKSNGEPSQAGQFIHRCPYQRLGKQLLGCVFPRGKNRLTKPEHFINCQKCSTLFQEDPVLQFRSFRDYLNNC